MTADLLRRAAARIRETAQAATPGPWWANPIATEAEVDVYSGTGSSEDIAVADGAYRADAEHIALWSPDVAELVAKVLDSAVQHFKTLTADDTALREWGMRPEEAESALAPEFALARRILGGQP